MSTTTPARQGAALGAPGSQGPRARDRASSVFAGATGIGLIHALDDAIVNRQPGVPITQHLWALTAVAVIAVPAVLLFPRMRTGLRALTALVFGAVTLVNGALHAIHLAHGSISGSDATGLLAAVAGVVLVLLAAALPFQHRGERTLPPFRRWALRVAAATSTGALLFFVVLPVGVGIGQTHLFRTSIGSPPNAYHRVTFRSSDGLELAGWYTPSRNGAAVVVVSSAGGDRLGSRAHARLLADHGYGVLVYDARGSGESEGSPNGFGWNWDRDVAGALAFLRRQPEVDPGRLGGLGLSTGADVLIEVAASDPSLRAVVADGATGRSLADVPPGDTWAAIQIAPVLATASVLSGTRPGPPLEDLAAAVTPTPLLLIATGSLPGEIAMNERYARAAKPPVDLWVLPEAHHTAAIRDEAAAYERRVVAHFDDALLRP